MKEEITPHKKKTGTRREVLKKVGTASVFLAPTIASFKIADIAVAGSGGSIPQPSVSGKPFNILRPPYGFGAPNGNGPPNGNVPPNGFKPPRRPRRRR